MKPTNRIKKPLLPAVAMLLAAFAMGACHEEEKLQPEHEGEGRMVVAVNKVGGQSLTLRVYGDKLDKPLESPVDAAEGETGTTKAVDSWLAAANYDVLLFPHSTTQVTINGTEGFGSAVVTVCTLDGATTLPSVDHPVYVAAHAAVKLSEKETNELTLQPKDLRKMVRLTVTMPDGRAGSAIEATLDGVAETAKLATGKVATAGTLGMALPAPGAQNSSSAMAGVLGVADGARLLTLSWQSADGTKLTYSEEVTGQLVPATGAAADTIEIAVTASAQVPIRLYTSIKTRAVVDVFDETEVNIAAGIAAGAYSESWTGKATAGEIVLDPVHYYPADGSPVYLRGYYPAAPLEEGKVHYKLTGQEDLMLSVEQNGSLTERFDNTRSPLVYSHLLTQLNFKLKLTGAPDTYKLRSLKLNGLAAQASVDLFSGTVQPVGTAAPVVIYADPGTGGFPIVNGVLTLPGYILVQPEAELTMDMVLNIDNIPANDLKFSNIPVKFTGGSGNAYEVEIAIKIPPVDPDDPDDPDDPVDPDDPPKTQITITATVTDWKTGPNGEVDIPSKKQQL